MAIEKRTSQKGRVTYRCRLRLKDGGDISATHVRKTDALDWEAAHRDAIRSGKIVQGRQAPQHTVVEVLDRYLDMLPSFQLKDQRNRKRHVEWWKKEFGALPLSELTPARIAAARDRLALLPVKSGAGATRPRQPATTVRYLASLSHVLSIAVDDWAWLPENPVRKVRKPKQPRGRLRFLDDDERVRLLNACRESTSTTLYPSVVLALATGMRRGEIFSLRWHQVDLELGTITLHDTKNGERRSVYLSGYPLKVLRTWASSAPQPSAHVFPGSRAGAGRDITKPWDTALKRAGIEGFRFHDLRHTTASTLAMGGKSMVEIGEVLGHKSPQMTKRYAHLSGSHTRNVLAGMVSQFWPMEEKEGVDLAPAGAAESLRVELSG